jgi:hypothetical protein
MNNSLTLLRIEYKLDQIISALQNEKLMMVELPDLKGVEEDVCPLCRQAIKIVNNFETETSVYTCGCQPPVAVVPGISTLLLQRKTHARTEGNPADQVPPDQSPQGDRDR